MLINDKEQFKKIFIYYIFKHNTFDFICNWNLSNIDIFYNIVKTELFKKEIKEDKAIYKR